MDDWNLVGDRADPRGRPRRKDDYDFWLVVFTSILWLFGEDGAMLYPQTRARRAIGRLNNSARSVSRAFSRGKQASWLSEVPPSADDATSGATPQCPFCCVLAVPK